MAGGEGSVMMSTILLEKRARKIAEDDALRLYNRVRQLLKEEDKALKRISETKKKAKEIVKLRERNELLRQEKEQRLRELEELIEQQRVENLRLKEEQLKNKTERENEIYTEKVQVVQQTKEERAELEKLLAESKLLSRKEALDQKESVRKAQEDARRKLEAIKVQKLQQAQEDYERRLQDEVEAKMVKEREIERLAQLEAELIERLRSKQVEQRRAYQQLEAVLALGTSAKGSKAGSPRTGTRSGTAQQQQQQPPGEPNDEDVARQFSVYDTEGCGEISTVSLEALMRDLNVPLNAAQLSQAIAQLDAAQTGRISFGEFLLWWKG